jgi:hypothetical protein
MNRKALIIGSVLAASLTLGATAQADDYYQDDGFPYFIGGLWLGLTLDQDHYRDHDRRYYRYRHHPYPHGDHRRSYSHGYRHNDRYKYDSRHDRHDRGHDRYDRGRSR